MLWPLKGKILSRVGHFHRGLLNQDSDLSCILYGHPEGGVNHLFCKFPLANHLWHRFLNLMGVTWVFKELCTNNFES